MVISLKKSTGSLSDLTSDSNELKELQNFNGVYSALGVFSVQTNNDEGKPSVIQQQKPQEELPLLANENNGEDKPSVIQQQKPQEKQQRLAKDKPKQERDSSYVNYKDPDLYNVQLDELNSEKDNIDKAKDSLKKNNIFAKIWSNRVVKIVTATMGLFLVSGAITGVTLLKVNSDNQNLSDGSAISTTSNTTLATNINNGLSYSYDTKLNESFLSTLSVDSTTIKMLESMEVIGNNSLDMKNELSYSYDTKLNGSFLSTLSSVDNTTTKTLENMEVTDNNSLEKANSIFVDDIGNAQNEYINIINHTNRELLKSIENIENIVGNMTTPFHERWIKYASGDKAQTTLKFFETTIGTSFDVISTSSIFGGNIRPLRLFINKLVDETARFLMVYLISELTGNDNFDKKIDTNMKAVFQEKISESSFLKYNLFLDPLISATSASYQACTMFIKNGKINKLIVKAKETLASANLYISLCKLTNHLNNENSLNDEFIELANELKYNIIQADNDNKNYHSSIIQYNNELSTIDFSNVKQEPTNFYKFINDNFYEIKVGLRDTDDKDIQKVKNFIKNLDPTRKSFILEDNDSYKQAKILEKKAIIHNKPLNTLIKQFHEKVDHFCRN